MTSIQSVTDIPSAYRSLTPDFRICRLLNGLWQVSGGHGAIDSQKAIPDMLAYHENGFTTWDVADHYGPAEDFIGVFRKQLSAQYGNAALSNMQAFTKWVPRPGRVTREIVNQAVDTSLRRMNAASLDVLQFHWWDYNHSAYLDALHHLSDLQREGKIRYLALTNFDTQHLQIIVEQGISILSNQVQYSLVDQRPQSKMAQFCQANNIHLLTYGTYCGGLLSEKYLNQLEPSPAALTTVSLRKYKNMIDAWGGWTLFQSLLTTLQSIAQKHQSSIPNVAVRWILNQPAVAGVIVGARLGVSEHRQDNVHVFNFDLDSEDNERIQSISSQSRNLMRIIGDCGDEYRR